MAPRIQDASLPAAVLLLLLSLGYPAVATLPYFSGGCPSPDAVAYSATDLSGVWYEARRTPYFVEAGSSCVSWDISETTAGTLAVETSLKYTLSTKTMTSTLTQVEGSSDADFTFTINKLPGLFFGLPATTLQVIDVTSDYLVAFSCTPKLFGLKSKQLLWVLTSDRNPSNTIVANAVSAATNAGINTSRLEVVSQTDC